MRLVMLHPIAADDVAQTILRYLDAHPDACDSADGICDWWLVRQQRSDTRIAVAAALDQLVAAQRVEASTGGDGLTVYRAMRAVRPRSAREAER